MKSLLLRLIPILTLVVALFNPRIATEEKTPLSDIVLVLSDDSFSQTLGERREQTEAALTALKSRLASFPNLEVRVEHVSGSLQEGTLLFAAMERALADIPRDRLAGVIAITDGRVHDRPTRPLGAPFHALITGAPGERDRRIVLTKTPSYALVGKTATLGLLVEDPNGSATAEVEVRLDGQSYLKAELTVGKEETMSIPIHHAGTTVVEVIAASAPNEVSLANNRAALGISGVRDRLKVLLISGEPHAGERAWRNLLKADPAVDLIHFTILRQPEKEDGTPLNELALITFPVRELFEDKLTSFDLVVFDRYRQRNVFLASYYQALADYVRNGGALLAAVGTEFTEPQSLAETALGEIFPARPVGKPIEQSFVPRVSEAGRLHPVTSALSGEWGGWLRQIPAVSQRGVTLLEGVGQSPLLVLDKVGKGRVALLLSDTSWLWTRGYQGGGPHDELLRRVAHWLMKEPDLEEESLSAELKGGRLSVVRRSLSPLSGPATVTTPDGTNVRLVLEERQKGVFVGEMEAAQPGTWQVEEAELRAIAASLGPPTRETAELMTATPEVLAPLAQSARFLAEGGLPALRRIGKTDTTQSGEGWIGLVRQEVETVVGSHERALLPPWLLLLLGVGGMVMAWGREGR